jgi:hypothetical protein
MPKIGKAIWQYDENCWSVTFLPLALAGPRRAAGPRGALSPLSAEALAVRRSHAALQVMRDTAGELAVPASPYQQCPTARTDALQHPIICRLPALGIRFPDCPLSAPFRIKMPAGFSESWGARWREITPYLWVHPGEER